MRDVSRQMDHHSPDVSECLDALCIARMSGVVSDGHQDPMAIDYDILVQDTLSSPDTTATLAKWRAEYLSRRKMLKSALHNNNDAASTMNGDNHFPVDGLTDIDTLVHDDDSPVAPHGIPDAPLSAIASTLPRCHESICDEVCNWWMLNSDQQCAFRIVTDHAHGLSGPEPLHMLLAGPAGSGKSRVIDALRDFFTIRGKAHRFRIASYMGIAANNVNGVTLHSALNINSRSHSNMNEELMHMWSSIDYLFVDEVSMISCEFLYSISTSLSLASGCKLPFGGFSLILAGDLAQLPPVAETHLYAYINPSDPASSTDKFQKKVKGKLLWLSISTVVVLSTIN